MKMWKENAFVENTGHFDNETNFPVSQGMEGLNFDNIKPQKLVWIITVFGQKLWPGPDCPPVTAWERIEGPTDLLDQTTVRVSS